MYDVSSFEILDVNESAIQHYGYSRDEFLKLTIKDLRPKEEIPKLVAAHSDIDSKFGNIYFGVFTHQKKTGEKNQDENQWTSG
ncbi:PAS domain-containing protein [Algoriphagus boritolerans]|uniref:PAS domain-containing protein n=1 Tax=Algoriphagus boritolerans TaxID=308111 RepID=UPI000A5171F8